MQSEGKIETGLVVTMVFFFIFGLHVFIKLLGIDIISGVLLGMDFGDELKAVSVTKENMGIIRRGLVNFQKDMGKFPRIGKGNFAACFLEANLECLGRTDDTNVLVRPLSPDRMEKMEIPDFAKKWQGPYLERSPAECMNDAWGEKISYEFSKGTLFLHSPGPDGVKDDIDDIRSNYYEGDDLLMIVSQLRLSKKNLDLAENPY